ncbi:MAG: hypothetical protein ACFFER_12475 [Candidatus Thorarchaeota archaeon]
MNFIQIMNNLGIIIEKLDAMRLEAVNKHGSWILKTEPNAFNVFSVFDKVVTVPLELLVYYKALWENPATRQPAHDMEERIKVITSMCFVSCLSALEYFMKDCLRKTVKGPLLSWYKGIRKEKRHISFYDILEESRDEGILSQSDFDKLDGVRLLRNALVHNNGISDLDYKWKIDDVILEFKKDHPVRHKLWAYSGLIETINRQTGGWAKEYLEPHSFQS